MSTKSKCPICTKMFEDKSHAPFCSQRCKQVDLGHWLTGVYTIPDEQATEEETKRKKLELF